MLKIAASVAMVLLSISAYAETIGPLFGSVIGPPRHIGVLSANGGGSTVAIASLNAGWAARHIASTALDVKAVKVHWSAVSTPGQVRVRYETVDSATGKPNGAYDANAVLSAQAPSVGVQTYTFSTLPTTGRTVGNSYAVTVVTTTAGTTHTVNSHFVESIPAAYPSSVLTTSDAGANWTETLSSTPIVVLVMEDDTEISLQEGMTPFSAVTSNNVFGTNGIASKITTGAPLSVAGVDIISITKVGTPAGDLRIRVMDSHDVVVGGTTLVIDKDNINTNMSTRGGVFLFPTPVILPDDTYRIVVDCGSCADSSNCWRVSTADSMSANSVPEGYASSVSSNVSSSPPTWSDSTSKLSTGRFVLSKLVTAGFGVIGG